MVSQKTIDRLQKEKRLDVFYDRMTEMGFIPGWEMKRSTTKPKGWWLAPNKEAKNRKGIALEVYGDDYAIWMLTEEFKEKDTKEEEVIH